MLNKNLVIFGEKEIKLWNERHFVESKTKIMQHNYVTRTNKMHTFHINVLINL